MSGITMTLSRAADVLGAARFGVDATFNGVVIDSRQVVPGNLFVALPGEHVNGNAFVDDATSRGAAAVMVEGPATSQGPGLIVDNARGAMGELATYWRNQFDLPVAAVTGSNGKTTTKEMIAAIAARAGPVLFTQGNLNNDLGVPLTLFRLDHAHTSAVIEMGANHEREIGPLAGMAKPVVGLITQCAPAHLEGFGSLEGVARGKGELIEQLPVDGTAVLNADDRFISFWRSHCAAEKVLTFGLEQPADVTATWHQSNQGLVLQVQMQGRSFEVKVGLLGRHNVMNALAAIAVAHSLGLGEQEVRAGLAEMKAVPGRLALNQLTSGAPLIDDSYNANPASTAAAIEVLMDFEGPRWLVFGDMAELGDITERAHREVGERARAAGVDRLFTLGPYGEAASRAFGSGAKSFTQIESLTNALASDNETPGAVLVKGSRSMAMERVVQLLQGQPSPCC
jgi:UDP-N-acetylmuramoyl-tripeptide--D-alanyl-D-alanine ligase